jgi:hypothetical protein
MFAVSPQSWSWTTQSHKFGQKPLLSMIDSSDMQLEGRLSDLDTEENNLYGLTNHIRDTIRPNDDEVRWLRRGLLQETDDLQYPGLYLSPPTRDAAGDGDI